MTAEPFLRCSECGGSHPASEFEKRVNGQAIRLGSSRYCIAKAQRAAHGRRKSWERFWAEGPKQERRVK